MFFGKAPNKITHVAFAIDEFRMMEAAGGGSKTRTLQDAIRVIEHYADLIVLRHPEAGAAEEAANYTKSVIINGGDGKGEHPVQGFSDIYTIFEERGMIDGLNVTLLGDLKYSRAHHSMALGLSNFDINISFVSPKGLEMPDDIREVFEGRSLYEPMTL